jgi:hypothetical protein
VTHEQYYAEKGRQYSLQRRIYTGGPLPRQLPVWGSATKILRNFVQFGGHASHTPCAAMNFGFGHGSRHPVPNVKCVTSGPNLPRRCKKGRIFENFRLECRIFGGVTPNFVGCRSAESVFWVTGHNPCRTKLRSTWLIHHPYIGSVTETRDEPTWTGGARPVHRPSEAAACARPTPNVGRDSREQVG